MEVSGKGTGYSIFVQNDYFYNKQQKPSSTQSTQEINEFSNYIEKLLKSTPELKDAKAEDISIHVVPGGSKSTEYKSNDLVGYFTTDYEYNADLEYEGSDVKINRWDEVNKVDQVSVQKLKDKLMKRVENNQTILNSETFSYGLSILNQILSDDDGTLEQHSKNTKSTDEQSTKAKYGLLQLLIDRDKIQSLNNLNTNTSQNNEDMTKKNEEVQKFTLENLLKEKLLQENKELNKTDNKNILHT